MRMGFLVQEEFYDEWDNPKDKRNNGTEFPDKVNFYTRGHAEFFQEYAKTGTEGKIDYIGKRIAQMVGDQITVFMSFPEKDREIRQKFRAFDRELKEKSPEIYRRSGEESGTLRLFRKMNFKCYAWIARMCKKRNHIGED